MTDPETPNERDQLRAWAARPSQKSARDTPHPARVELDLADRYLALLGFFRGEEFMEEARERPFSRTT
jgi:hypothetical protein